LTFMHHGVFHSQYTGMQLHKMIDHYQHIPNYSWIVKRLYIFILS
jgi:hypothetical protein